MNARTKGAWRELSQVLFHIVILLSLVLPNLFSMYYYFIGEDVQRAIFWLLFGYFSWKLGSK